MLGTPNEESWPGVHQLPDYKPSFPHWSSTDLRDHVTSLGDEGIELLQLMLTYDTAKRISGMSHPLASINAFTSNTYPRLQRNAHSTTRTSTASSPTDQSLLPASPSSSSLCHLFAPSSPIRSHDPRSPFSSSALLPIPHAHPMPFVHASRTHAMISDVVPYSSVPHSPSRRTLQCILPRT